MDYLQLLGGEEEELENAAELMGEFSPKILVAKPNINGFFQKEMIHAESCYWYHDEMESILWEDIKISSPSGYDGVCIQANGAEILVISKMENTGEGLKCREDPVLAVFGETPGKSFSVDPDYIVLTDDESVPFKSGDYYSLEKNGRLVAEIKNGILFWKSI